MVKEKYIKMYMDIAFKVAQYSVAEPIKVGCVIVKPDDSLTIGLNGTPSGWETNVCEYEDENGNLVTKPQVLHAEANACGKLARGTGNGMGSEAFVTRAPCLRCAKQLLQSGIIKVYYVQEHHTDEGIQFLRKCSVEVIKIEEK